MPETWASIGGIWGGGHNIKCPPIFLTTFIMKPKYSGIALCKTKPCIPPWALIQGAKNEGWGTLYQMCPPPPSKLGQDCTTEHLKCKFARPLSRPGLHAVKASHTNAPSLTDFYPPFERWKGRVPPPYVPHVFDNLYHETQVGGGGRMFPFLVLKGHKLRLGYLGYKIH